MRERGRHGDVFRDVNQTFPNKCERECVEWVCIEEERPFGPPKVICICQRWGCT